MAVTQNRPNILLLCADQQRWDTICARSGCRTPTINRLAEEGVTFERSYTPVSLCCPARAMLLTGAYGWHMGVFNQIHVPERMSYGIRDDAVTYAMRMREAGYRAGYVGKWHAHWLRSPLDYGYDRASAPSSYGPDSQARCNFRPDDLYASRVARYPQRIDLFISFASFRLTSSSITAILESWIEASIQHMRSGAARLKRS